LKKKTPVWVFCFFNPFFWAFTKKTSFRYLKKNAKTPFRIVYIASCNITIFKITQYNFLQAYLLWHSKVRVMKCTPSLFSQSVVGQFTPKW